MGIDGDRRREEAPGSAGGGSVAGVWQVSVGCGDLVFAKVMEDVSAFLSNDISNVIVYDVAKLRCVAWLAG